MSFDIVSFVQNNISTLVPVAQGVATAVISALLFRKKNSVETGTKEFEKFRAAKFDEAADVLLDMGRITYSDLYKYKNYAKIVKKADELKKERSQEIPRQDFDWHVRFLESCGYVSDDEVQNLWASILDHEIEKPGSYSLRTLDCLRNMSKEEAILFSRACKCSIAIGENILLPRFGKIMENNGLSYNDVLKLEDCGLLKGANDLCLTITVGEEFCPLEHDNYQIMFVRQSKDSNHGDLKISGYAFSSIGKELYNVAGGKIDIGYMQTILQNEYSNFEFKSAKITSRQGDRLFFELENRTLSINEKEH